MPTSFDFKGKRAIVTGGSRGIGRAIADGLIASGAKVSICARGREGVEAARTELAQGGAAVHAAVCDMADAEAVAGYVEAAAAALGGLDVLVNNASGLGAGDDEAGWAASLNVDVLGSVRASHAAIPHLERAGGGAIVHISSISGLAASARNPAYGAAKAALNHYALSQAQLLASKRIRVNCVAPGSIEFPGGMWEKRKTGDPALYQRILKGIPFGRLGHPEEVAALVLFLASDAGYWITGQTVAVDGGQSL